MKETTFIHRLLMMAAALLVISCSSEETQAQEQNSETMSQKMYITIDGKTFPVQLVDNSATQTLVATLQDGDITYEASDYGGFEKVGALGRSLPTSNTQITTQAGDVILYSGNQIVLFYGSNSWSYTRLGRMEYSTQAELEAFLKAGQGNVTVTLSLSSTTAISEVSADKPSTSKAYTLQGTLAQAGQKGIIIENGKKIIK
jgi:hypothetical protein